MTTTPEYYSSSMWTTTPPCELRIIDYDSSDVIVGASSAIKEGRPVMALQGSEGFWSPRDRDDETSPYIFFQVE